MTTVLITGNRKGIGRYLTERLLGEGYFVIGCSRADSDCDHENYQHYICDVSDPIQVKEFFKNLKAIRVSVDILINNAGVASMNHFITTPSRTSEKIFDINFHGTLNFSKYCSKMMMKKNWGRIINFTTVAVPLNLEGELSYASSKAAIESATKIMSKELGTFGITVNCLGPNPINTDLIKTLNKNKIENLIKNQSIKRLGEFDDVYNVIKFFISNESSFITGQKLYLGGIC